MIMKRIYKVIKSHTGETCAVFGAMQYQLAIALADNLHEADQTQIVVIEETVVYDTSVKSDGE